MKYNILLLVALLGSGCVIAKEPRMKVTFHVTDAETSEVLTNAAVMVHNKGWKTKQVDSEGFCSFEGKGLSMGWKGHSKLEGYYDDSSGVKFTKWNRVLNRREPWNPTIKVKMRKIKNPVSVSHKRQDWTVVPEFGKQVGYDLEVGDWVTPYGKGKTEDFLFEMKLNRKSMSDAEASYTLTFSNPLDGIQEYLPPEGLRSSFIFPYIAPTNGYKSSLYQHDINTPYGPSKTTEKENINYIFRVRTKTNEDGNIVSACYGRIRGELKISRKGQVEFGYWFNPDPQSRSLESDKQPY